MIGRADDGVKIAGGTTVQTGIAFSCDADTLSVTGASFNANLKRFGALDATFAMTHGTGGNILAGSVTTRTRHIEFHTTAGLLDGALAFALWADARLLDEAVAGTVLAGVAPGDIETHHTAADGRPERDVDLVFEIGAGFGSNFFDSGATAATVEHAAEDVAEVRVATGTALTFPALEEIGEIEAPKVEVDTLRSGAAGGLTTGKAARESLGTRITARFGVGFGGSGVDIVGVEPELVVNLALLGIAENVVGFRERLEFFFGSLVAGIDVGMILARKFAKRLADVVRRGAFLHTQNLVIIFLGGGHFFAAS